MVKQQEIQQISTFEERSDEDQMVLSQLSITEEITTSRSIEAVSSMCFYCLFGYIFNLYHLNLDSVDGNAANQLVDLPNFDLRFLDDFVPNSSFRSVFSGNNIRTMNVNINIHK